MRFGVLAFGGMLVGCSGGGGATVPDPQPRPDKDTTFPTDPNPTDDDPEDSGIDTAEPSDTGAPVLCDLADAPLSANLLSGYPSSEEFHFDAAGNIWNASDGDSAIFRTPYGGPIDFFAPYGAIETAGTRILPDGSGLAVCNEWSGSVDRIDTLTGSQTLLVGGLDSPNSIGFDDRGYLYVAAYGAILRVALSGGPVEVIVDLPFYDLDGITFSPDFRTLYYNWDEGGTVGYTELDTDGTVLSSGILAEINQPGWGSELDGMAVDSCGNLYVTATSGDLYRVDPAGNVERYYVAPGDAWTTAVNFGSGVGGWGRDRLYVMDRTNGLIELEVGVEGRPEPHYP